MVITSPIFFYVLYIKILTSINKKTQSTNALKFMIQFNGRNYKMIHYQTIQIINYIFIKNFNNSKTGIKNRL